MQCNKTQGQQLVAALKKRWMSYSDMIALGVSLCPWKRIPGAIPADHELKKRENSRGLVEWRVVKRVEVAA
jgi:hypothetical protein